MIVFPIKSHSEILSEDLQLLQPKEVNRGDILWKEGGEGGKKGREEEREGGGREKRESHLSVIYV